MAALEIYTDGACSGNGTTEAKGGWGVVAYVPGGIIQELGGADFSGKATSNRMELMGIIAGMKLAKMISKADWLVKFKTDSEYVKKGCTLWIPVWKENDWRTRNQSAVVNRDLWEEIDSLMDANYVFEQVAGHSGIPGNERADAIAVAMREGREVELEQFYCDNEFKPMADGGKRKASADDYTLTEAVRFVCRSIKDFRDQNWNPEQEELTDDQIRRVAAYIIREFLFNRQGEPIRFDGAELQAISAILFPAEKAA